MQPTHRRRRGFTLIEVLLVLVIIGLLAGVAIFAIGGTQDQANIDTTRAKLKQLETALERFSLRFGRLPTNEEGLNALISGPQDMEDQQPTGAVPFQPLIQQAGLVDAWGTPINYELVEGDLEGTTRRFRIWSSGPNRVNDNGEGDDILPEVQTGDTD